MRQEDVKQVLEQYPTLRNKLFARGFFFTDAAVDEEAYPFYGIWKKNSIAGYHLLVAPGQQYFISTADACSMILVGHAYNPFSMQSDENVILLSLQEALRDGEELFWNELGDLTGVFTLIWMKDGRVYVAGDATGMQTTFYTVMNQQTYVASHTNLLGDILSLSWDPYVKELSSYRFFGLLGNSLPGNLTQFAEVKRLIPNHYLVIDETKTEKVKRFYQPEILPKKTDEIVDEASVILQANLKLISEKWEKPGISMTGGCDSKTTLACADGLYDKFSYFSYTSSESEEVDAIAAGDICKELGLKHKVYRIPLDDEPELLEATKTILQWNNGDIRPNNKNDVRKRLYFADIKDFDVEVKSWASEVGRAYYSKRFHGRTNFGQKPTPRACTTLYKFFFHNRKLVKKTDAVFADYLSRYFVQAKENPLPWQEQFFWEFRVPSWNGMVITGEHRYSFDITIPYNNRKLLALLLSAPIEQRIRDEVYTAIRKRMNPKIDETGISVTNLKHTENREKAENIYYFVHSKIPF